jgi:hypothetical protein
MPREKLQEPGLKPGIEASRSGEEVIAGLRGPSECGLKPRAQGFAV